MAKDPKHTNSPKIDDFLPSMYKGVSMANIPKDVAKMALNAYTSYTLGHTGNRISQEVLDRVTNLSFISSGLGGYANQMQTFLSTIDRYQHNILPVNSEYSGLTFITRPRLCLKSANLRTNRKMAPLDTLAKDSMAFMLRALLDTNLATDGKGGVDEKIQRQLLESPMFDLRNPFLVPACNALTHIGGLPDPMIQTTTTEGGFFCEDQTFVIGGDNLNRTYNLQLGFKDIQYGPISALFFYWIEYMRCVTRGLMAAYADDIDQQVMNYTVSIYRFNLDPSKQYITKYSKATGCFPTSVPFGGMMNKNQGEHFVNAATEFSIPFVANKVEYQDYAILLDFNTLMRRYCPTINDLDSREGPMDPSQKDTNAAKQHPSLPMSPIENFRGLPYITTDRHGIRMEFRRVPNPAYPLDFDLIDQMGALEYLDEIDKKDVNKTTNAAYYNPRMAKMLGPNPTEEGKKLIRGNFSPSDKIKVLQKIIDFGGGGSNLDPVYYSAESERLPSASGPSIIESVTK